MVMPKLETLFSRFLAYSGIKLVGYTAVFTAAGISLVGVIPTGHAAMAVGVAVTMTPFLP